MRAQRKCIFKRGGVGEDGVQKRQERLRTRPTPPQPAPYQPARNHARAFYQKPPTIRGVLDKTTQRMSWNT